MRIALAGLGTVGAATVRALRANAALLKARGQEIKLVAVSARDKRKDRDCDLSGIAWVDDPLDLASHDIDVVVDATSGARSLALELAEAALGNGKHFVTASKALIAAHGVDLARMAEKAELQLSFEAAVCGGIPVLKTLREGLAANRISSVRGILNGTTNYILTRMDEDGLDFDAALAEAHRQGYAEADPSLDIDGVDAAHKLAILSAVAFGIVPDISAISVEGIRSITREDLRDAAARGGRIKLIGSAIRKGTRVIQRVQPSFVPLEESLSRVSGVINGVEIVGDVTGTIFMQGPGAGGDATASAIVADLVDIARGHQGFAFGVGADSLTANN